MQTRGRSLTRVNFRCWFIFFYLVVNVGTADVLAVFVRWGHLKLSGAAGYDMHLHKFRLCKHIIDRHPCTSRQSWICTFMNRIYTCEELFSSFLRLDTIESICHPQHHTRVCMFGFVKREFKKSPLLMRICPNWTKKIKRNVILFYPSLSYIPFFALLYFVIA